MGLTMLSTVCLSGCATASLSHRTTVLVETRKRRAVSAIESTWPLMNDEDPESVVWGEVPSPARRGPEQTRPQDVVLFLDLADEDLQLFDTGHQELERVGRLAHLRQEEAQAESEELAGLEERGQRVLVEAAPTGNVDDHAVVEACLCTQGLTRPFSWSTLAKGGYLPPSGWRRNLRGHRGIPAASRSRIRRFVSSVRELNDPPCVGSGNSGRAIPEILARLSYP